MAIEEYVEPGEVRAVLGVSAKELKDEVIKLPLYEKVLNKQAGEISSSLIPDYKVVDAIIPGDRTDTEQEFHEAFDMFATFVVAKQLTEGLPLFSPRAIGDGKATVTRYSDSPYKETVEAVKLSYEEYRNHLKDKYADYGGGSEAPIEPIAMVGIMSPSSDPVTGT